MKTINLLFYSLLLTCFTACGISIKENYKVALESIESEDHQGAITLLSEIIDYDSTIYEAFQSRAFCYFTTSAYKKAIADYQKAYALSKNGQLQFNLGMSYIKIKQFNLAINCFNEFEKTDSNNSNLWLQKALCLTQLKNYSSALNYFQKAQNTFTDSISLLKNIGVCHFQLSNYNEAIDVLETYKDTIKDDQSTYEMIAFSYHKIGKYQRAKSYFDQMTELGMVLEEKTQTLLIKNLLKLGQRQYNKKAFIPSLQTFTKVIELDPINSEAYFNRGLVQLYYEKRKEACEDFNLAFSNGHPKAISIMKKNCKDYFD